MKIAFYPVFDSVEDLCQFVHRATWYLYPLREHIEQLDFFSSVNFDMSEIADYSNDLLDPSISSALLKFRELSVRSSSEISKLVENSDYIFVWDESKRNQLIAEKNKKNLKFEVVRVDHRAVQYADSFFLRFSEKIGGLLESYKEVTKERVDKHLKPLASEKVYLFGTGPNFSYVEPYDFSDGLVIACNSMVVNKEMLAKLSPDIFVIADPIFHAGPSGYAASFRSSFLEVLSEHSCPVVVPIRDYHLYRTYFPDSVVSRLVPVPFLSRKEGEGPSLNIFESYGVVTTSNILTLFQIPLACSLGERIYISGCDGRPLSHNNYFWSHNKSVQINDKMDTIKKAHPAFFNISYDDYYTNHINTLDEWICHGETIGRKFYNLTPSYIPSLQARTVDSLVSYHRKRSPVDVSVIIPLYCAEEYLEEAVRSVVDGCDFSLEVIIVDDFSEDGSLELAKSLAESHRNVHVYQNFHKKGVSGARNTGIDLAVGKYVCFLDADDFVFEGSLNARVAKLKSSSDIFAVHSTLEFVDASSTLLGVEVNTRRNISFRDCVGNPASFNTLMFKRSILEFLRFDESLTNGEDWLAFSRVLRKGVVSHYVPEGKAAYRIHGGSTVMKDISGHEERLRPVVDWVCGTVDAGEAHPKFREGLPVEKSQILLARKQGMLVQAVFNGQVDAVHELLQDSDLVSKIRQFSSDSLQAFKVPFVRAFCLRIEDRHLIEQRRVESAVSCLGVVENLAGDCCFTRLIKNYFPHSSPASLKPSLRSANSLFAQGRYEQARAEYEKCLAVFEGKLSDAVQFNIDLCDQRIKFS